MAFSGNYVCTSFKSELLTGTHNFSSHTFKLALFTNNATLNASTTAYSTSDEASGTGYSAGGVTVSNVSVNTSGTTAFVDFDDVAISSSSITARGALLYNSSASNKAVAVFDFGSDKTSSSSTFTMPVNDASNALVRIA